MRLQCLESAVPQNTAAAVDLRRRVDERALDKEEEDYFNEDRFFSLSGLFILFFIVLLEFFSTHFSTGSDEEDSASASNTKKEKPASNTKKEEPKPHISNGVAASPASSRYSCVPQ